MPHKEHLPAIPQTLLVPRRRHCRALSFHRISQTPPAMRTHYISQIGKAIYGAQYQPQSLPASSVTRIHYAFADIDSEGNVVSSDTYADLEKHYTTDSWSDNGTNAYGCVKQLYILKKQNRNTKVLLSVGGWTWSSKFSPIAADPTMRQNFASSAVQLVTDWGFDGIDIDWEFNAYIPAAEDTQNIVLLLQAVRNAFNAWSASHAPGYHFLITVASPAGPAVYSLWDIPAMDPYVDTWSLMAYDYAGAWSNATGHASNIYFDAEDMPATPYSTDQAVSAYIAAGVHPSKIVMGLPLYGRSFEGTLGLGEPFDGVGSGDDLGTGQWRFRDLPRPGATEFYDPVAKASYSYDEATQELISYDTVQSVDEKSAYLKSKGLGGAMFWEASDDKNGTESLVVAMAGQLGRLDAAQNLLNYPTSQYDNIRNGMPGS
ncbi:family 18 glycoside hydrolase [Cryphonectria parasitica EP155]|uniref:chitinase n=1 Tax=Cryphonectria parasitica (strain ATCC 38755 / EP155) TaxID=660469 RepID=A0A9P4XX45_CRYP1|nr:family 18 glycoside hydrolase [Cryphonectria parasitica EP155]KAF3762511.1 family 18 glycoside hydrolase [Cryphonectria parasitica EP155]